MLEFRRSLLLCVALLLAACGTQTQLPEAVSNGEMNVESARHGGYLKVHIKKYVKGYQHGPRHAKYVFKLVCRDDKRDDKVVLSQNIELTKANSTLDGSYWGVKGYKCYLKEIADDHRGYSVGDKVKVKIYQHAKHGYRRLYDEEKWTDRDTYKSGYFFPRKGGKLYIDFYNYYYPGHH